LSLFVTTATTRSLSVI